jgi:hypothetical protein
MTLKRLHRGTFLFAATARANAAGEPSVVATAVATWILKQKLPFNALVEVGLCDSTASCGQSGDPGIQLDSPLRATAAVTATRRPDRASFPMAL